MKMSRSARTTSKGVFLLFSSLFLLADSFSVYPSPRQANLFSTSISAVSSSTSTQDAQDKELLQSLLKQINVSPPWKSSDEKKVDYSSTRTFNYVLSQLAAASAGPQAEQLLRYMLEQSSTQRRSELLPDDISFNSVLAAYSENYKYKIAVRKQYATKIQALFREWQDLFQRGVIQHDVDRISFNTVISALAKAQEPEKAEAIFQELQTRYIESGKDPYWKPDAVSHASLMHAYAVAGNSLAVKNMFDQRQESGPANTIHSYNDVLSAYCNANEPDMAKEFLDWWLQQPKRKKNRNAVVPDARSYNILLHGMDLGDAEEMFESMPVRDAVSYTTMIAAYSRERDLESIEAVMDMAWKDSSVTIGGGFISNVLYSLANTQDLEAPVYAESVVREFIQRGNTPDILVYNALLYCWSKAGSRDAAASRVLDILQEIRNSPTLQPDVRTYTNVLDALKSTGRHMDEAERIVKQMEEFGPAPTVQTYTALIQNYARSQQLHKASKAAALLKRIPSPNIVSYNTVLNACEHTDATDPVVREEALKVACIVFDEIRSAPAAIANHVTYGTFLGVLANCMPAELRQEIVHLVFRRCCIEGQVSALVLKKLRKAVGSDEGFKELLRGYDEQNLPESWTCNVWESKARYQS